MAASITRKVDKLQQLVQQYFPNCHFTFTFLGASELLELARQAPPDNLSTGAC